jgi:quercetin dioxygenase-like cupin family protein
MRIVAAVMIAACGIAQGQLLWAPKGEPAVYTAPHKPHTKLSEVLAKNKGKAEWRELVVDDRHLTSSYVQLKPGYKSLKAMYPDTRIWWVVLDGEIRFEIETKEPFVAKKGSMVQAPFQTWFQYEVVGSKPALMFVTTPAGAKLLFDAAAAPPKMPGLEMIQARFNNRVVGQWKHGNVPHITFDEVAAEMESGKRKGTQRIVQDDRGTANFIYGYNSKLPPLDPKVKGHYHPEGAEYWLIMKGQIRYPIEKAGVFVAEEGDVIYVPPYTWHAPRWWGDGPSCRLAMNGFPDISHLFPAD